MKAISAKYLVIFLFFHQGQVHSGERELLDALGFSMIKGELMGESAPSPLSSHELEQEEAAERLLYMEDLNAATMSSPMFELRRREREELLQLSMKRFREGGKSLIYFQVFIGSQGMLGVFDHMDVSEGTTNERSAPSKKLFREWILKDSNKIMVYSESGTMRVASSEYTGTWMTNLFDAMGNLGRAGLFPEVSDDGKKLLKKTGKLTIVEDKESTTKITSSFKGSSGLLESFTRGYTWEGGWQREAIKYKDFKKIGNVTVPLSVTYSTKRKEYFDQSMIKIDSWKLSNGDDLKKVQLPKFGYVDVQDMRVSPPLQYPAYGKILSEKQLVDFVADPTLLKAYIKEVEQRSAER